MSRSDSPEQSWLAQRHATLSELVDDLDSRRAMSAEEALELARLKKEKLRTKDALTKIVR